MFKDADFSTSGVHYDSCCWLSRCNVAVMLLNLFFTANSEQSRLHRNIEHGTEQTQS